MYSLGKRSLAEFFGTFWLVFGGCGSAVLSAKFFTAVDDTPINIGIELLGVSLAFGLTVLTMAAAIGHISGCHLNPAVSVGLVVGGRFKAAELLPYIVAQVVGAVAGAGVLYLIASGKKDFAIDKTAAGIFATNGYDAFSPGGYSLASCLVAEIVLTAFFLIIILGATDKLAASGFAPTAIGLGLTLIHLVGIPVTNLSVNPARSTGPALFVGGTPLMQLWLFWVAPIVGAALGAVVYRIISTPEPSRTT
jgi:aquaporin Z